MPRVEPLAWREPLPARPRRILVAGTSGSGKTTVAAALAVRLGLPHVDIDGLYHGPGWVPRLEFAADVAALAAREKWVTEWQYSAVRALLLARADLLVWLDLSRWRVMSQIVPRTLRRRLRRVELWNGNLEPPLWTVFTDRDHILRWPGAPTRRRRYGCGRCSRQHSRRWSFVSAAAGRCAAGSTARSRPSPLRRPLRRAKAAFARSNLPNAAFTRSGAPVRRAPAGPSGRTGSLAVERLFAREHGTRWRVRVLGVDPGLTRCGLGVVDGGAGGGAGGGRDVACVAVDVVRTPSDAPLAERLLAVGAEVEHWIALHRPDVVAVERVFSQHNVRTVMGTAQASGVVALLAARAGLPVVFHTPSEVKAAVTGEGRAGKQQVAAMVTRLLGLAEAPRPADAADALALAICHCWRAPMLNRMAQARERSAELARRHRARLAAAVQEANRPQAVARGRVTP
jgi:crossover junction endodeoxyribonuclease RuvC